MDMGLGFLGQYITAAELVGKEPTLTIERVTLEKVEDLKATSDEGGGKMRDRIVVYFKEARGGRGWLLNRTNAECIKELWGRETEGWLGHRITLHTQQVRVGPKMEPGIRVKGSPELTSPRSFEIKLPRKKPIKYTLAPTSKSTPTAAPKDSTLDAYTLAIIGAADKDLAAIILDEARTVLNNEDQARLQSSFSERFGQQ